MNDEHSDSLAAQAASWVPPWERQPREPNRTYQAAAEEATRAETERRTARGKHADADASPTADHDDPGGVGDGSSTADGQDARHDLSLAEPGWNDGLDAGSGADGWDGPSSDEAEGTSGAAGADTGDGDEAEMPFVGDGRGEALGVDSPAEIWNELEPGPSAGDTGPELPVPKAVEQAVPDEEDQDGHPADMPLPSNGDDAGDLFAAAADDDVGDEGNVDLVPEEFVPDEVENGDVSDVGAAVPGGAQPPSSPEAASIGNPGRAKAGSAVPEQGRGRRDGLDSVADGWARTSGNVGTTERKQADSAQPGARPVMDPAKSSAGAGTAEPSNGSKGVHLNIADAARPGAEASDLPALMEDAELAAALEAILLVVDEPVAEMQLAQILEQPTERVGAMLEDLSARYTGAGHGFDLRRAAGGWRLYTRPEYAAYVERFVLDGQSVRLTQAALETLAVVAYKQPVTRSRISAIRGVNCDGVMRTLVTRGLIEECGTEGETGAHLYRTTPLFLEKLGLNSVDQLPPLAPFLPDDVEEVLDASG